MPLLADRSAVVTGASSGIGHAVARALCGQGLRVAAVARTHERLTRTASELGATGFAADVTQEREVEELVRQLAAHFGDVPDILVNAAGAFELAPVAETSVAMFDGMIAANLRAPFLLMRELLPRMLARGSGHIVSIGSIAGRQALISNGAYSASKFGLRGLHEVLALELKGTGVRTTLIAPAATDTPLWDGIDRERHADLAAREEMLTADAVARCVLFALSEPVENTVPYIGIERS